MKRLLQWMMALSIMMSVTSCITHIDIGLDRPPYIPPQEKPEDGYDIDRVKFYQNNNWSLDPDERYCVFENGRDVYVDRIKLNSKDKVPYYLDLISEQSLNENYGGSLSKRIKDQALALIQDEKDGYAKLSEVLMVGNDYVDYDRLNSGYWYAYAFGMLEDGRLTGDYQSVKFRVQAETPTKGYMSWLGEWEVGDHRTRYVIQVKQDEPNYTYAISGWEGTVEDAKELVFLTDYNRENGDMIFYNQIIRDWQDDEKNWYDTMLCGTFYYYVNNEVEDIFSMTGPSTLAHALYADNKDKTEIVGNEGVTEIDGKDYPFDFVNMRFYDVPEDVNKEMLYYDERVPEFPLSMVRLGGHKSTLMAGEAPRTRSMQAVRHTSAGASIRKAGATSLGAGVRKLK